jgi:hypothetical protein
MIKSSVELMAEPIGFDIGNSDDVTQSALLNGMGRAFNTFQERNLDIQLCYISQKLTKQSENFILQLARFIESNRAEK